MRRGIVLLALIGGCDLVFELRDPPVNEPKVVTLTVVKQHVENNNEAEPVLVPDEIAIDDFAVRLHDGTEPELSMDPAGRILFTAGDTERYQITYTAGDGLRTICTDADTPKIDLTTFGRTDRVDASAGTFVNIGGLMIGGVRFYRVFSSGVWAVGQAAPAEPLVIPWDKVISFGGASALVDSGQNDRIHLGQYNLAVVANQLQYDQLVKIFTEPLLVMVDGMTNLVGNALVTPTTQCTTIVADAPAIDARFAELTEYADADRRLGFLISAIPSPETHPLHGFLLAGTDDPAPTLAPVGTEVRHFNGYFSGYTMVARFDISRERDVQTVDGPVRLKVLSSHNARVEPDSGTSCTPVDLFADNHRVAVPSIPVFDGSLLANDNTVIEATPGATNLRLAWTTDSGLVDAFAVALFEISGGKATHVRTFYTTELGADFDAEIFTPGATYYFSVVAIHGIPGALTGDFYTQTLPYDLMSINSGTFQVVR